MPLRHSTTRFVFPFLVALSLAACDDVRPATEDDLVGDGETDQVDASLDAAEVDDDVPNDQGSDTTGDHDEIDTPGPAPDCGTLGETACLATIGCVLEVAPDGYACRMAHNACELVKDRDVCSADESCRFDDGMCYCPPEVLCGCGGGPPPICRRAESAAPCRTLGGEHDCVGAETCCAAPDASMGFCSADPCVGSCESHWLIEVSRNGGLCAEGPCGTTSLVRADGYVFFDDETTATPVDAYLGASAVADLAVDLAAIDVAGLQDGYGPCCNAAFDGQDTYVTFYGPDGQAQRTVRISDQDQAPAALLEVAGAVDLLTLDLALRPPAQRAACHTPLALPYGGDGPTCQTAQVRTAWSWTLDGPANQHVGRDGVTLDGQSTLPATLELEGVVGDVVVGTAGAGFSLTTSAGDVWQLTVDAGPAGMPELCAVVGQSVQLTARVAQGGEALVQGLAVRSARGLLFAAEDGLHGFAAAAALPFDVEVGFTNCGESAGSCGPAATDLLVVTGPGGAQSLLGGESGRVSLSGEYDVVVYALSATRTGACDEVPYAWAAYGMAGTDTVCP